jgi:aldehyde dehydrogenase
MPAQLERLTKAAFVFKEGQGGGCPEPVVNKDFIGKDPSVLAQAAGVNMTGQNPIALRRDRRASSVRHRRTNDAVPADRAGQERGGRYRGGGGGGAQLQAHRDHSFAHVEHMTAMARALDTTLFIKNGWCMAGLGSGGEGYSQLFHRHADRRRGDQPQDFHPRPPLRDGR